MVLIAKYIFAIIFYFMLAVAFLVMALYPSHPHHCSLDLDNCVSVRFFVSTPFPISKKYPPTGGKLFSNIPISDHLWPFLFGFRLFCPIHL